MTDQKKPEPLADADLEEAQGGNTITVQICHQVMSDGNPAEQQGTRKQGTATTPLSLHGADKQRGL